MKRTLLSLIVSSLVLFSIQPVDAASRRSIPAKAYILLTDDEAVLYEKNASLKHSPASTVKLVTAMVALDRLDPSTCVTISRHAAATRSSRPRLKAGDELTVEALLHLALMKSTNSAAVALAEAAAGTEDAFVALMNQKAGEIGTRDTVFRNASGLPGTGQHTTALDLTIILKQALTYPLIREIIGKKQAVVATAAGREWTIGNTDALLWYRSDMVGGKTGFTNKAQHCFVGAMDTENGMIYTAVLGAPSRRRLWKSTQMLVSLGANPREQVSAVAVEEAPAAPVKKHTLRKKHRRATKSPIKKSIQASVQHASFSAVAIGAKQTAF
jgi:D-alanyl-D-alanine carboxypeptidase (penicillin-binding protein 5/6)